MCTRLLKPRRVDARREFRYGGRVPNSEPLKILRRANFLKFKDLCDLDILFLNCF